MWRKHLPEGCPPSDAIPTNGLVYRLTDKKIPEPEDFLSNRERKPTQPFNQPECIAGGLSIHTQLDDVKRLKRRVKNFKRKKICAGNLTSEDGVMKNTPHIPDGLSHHTWWIPDNQSPHTLFEWVDLGDSDE